MCVCFLFVCLFVCLFASHIETSPTNAGQYGEDGTFIINKNTGWMLSLLYYNSSTHPPPPSIHLLIPLAPSTHSLTYHLSQGEIYMTRSLDRDLPDGRAVYNFNVLAHDEVLTVHKQPRIILGQDHFTHPSSRHIHPCMCMCVCVGTR